MKQNKKTYLIKATLAVVAGAAILPLSASAAGYLQLSSYTGPPGSALTVQGYQFGSGTPATISLVGTSTSATVSNGSFAGNLTIPMLPSGNYTALATTPTDQASATYYVQNQEYYPNAQPSSWYLVPNQTLNFSGSGFAPNSQVMITGGDSTMTATADAQGSFSTTAFPIPFSWQNSSKTFTIWGPQSAYQIQLSVTIGSFYPGINPSSYWIGTGQSMSASVSGFAPNETVVLMVNGAEAARASADNSGSASFSFTTPSSGSSFTLTAQGLSSQASVSRGIGLHS